jgi:hypothetical protein
LTNNSIHFAGTSHGKNYDFKLDFHKDVDVEVSTAPSGWRVGGPLADIATCRSPDADRFPGVNARA